MTPLKVKVWCPEVRAELRGLWSTMRVTAPGRFEGALARIRNGEGWYRAVVSRIGGTIPWEFLAVVHQLESGGRWDRHVHNGDALTGRTVHVPVGRPVAAPENGRVYSWAESARDAMVMKGFDKVRDWSVERQLWLLEVYNGLGYRLYHGMASPYLWAGTNHYSRGKYVGDGKFSAVAVSKQAGAAGLLRQFFQEAGDGKNVSDGRNGR